MATINPTITYKGNNLALVRWAGLTTGDDGAPIQANLADYNDRTVQVGGTFGGSTVTLEGANVAADGYVTLNDAQGNPLSITVAAIETIVEAPLLVRPRVAGGAGVAVNVTMYCRRARVG